MVTAERLQRYQVEKHIIHSFAVPKPYETCPEMWMEYHIDCACCGNRAKIFHEGYIGNNKYLRANLCPGCYEVRLEVMKAALNCEACCERKA